MAPNEFASLTLLFPAPTTVKLPARLFCIVLYTLQLLVSYMHTASSAHMGIVDYTTLFDFSAVTNTADLGLHKPLVNSHSTQ